MSIKTTLVQNGTNEVTNQDIGQIQVIESENGILIEHRLTARERFFSEYSVFAVKTAQSSIEMCRVVREAKKSLSKSDFKHFCNDIGHEREDGTIRKYCRIGEQYDKLIQYTNLLPNSWTSIYTITQLPSETFDALAATDTDMSKLSGKQLQSLVQLSKPKSSTSTIEAAVESSTDVSDSSSAETTADAQNSVIATTASTQSEHAADEVEEASTDVIAVEATTELLERVKTNKSVFKTDISPPSDVTFPYEVLIRFKSSPTEDAWWDLVEEIDNLVDKYNFDVDVVETRPSLFE